MSGRGVNAIALLGAVTIVYCIAPLQAQTTPASPATPAAPAVSPGTTPSGTSSPLSVPASTPTSEATTVPPVSPSLSNTPVNVPEDYRLDTDDTIAVDVARHGDISRSLRIPTDGTIRLSRLEHAVVARGKTCAELAETISERLVSEGKLVMRPGQVTVAVVGTRPRRVYVRGSAVGGREHDLQNGERISELVASMGGVPQPDRLKAVLTGPGRPQPLPINLDAALNVPNSPENVTLLEGDTLTIDAPRKIRLYVEGEGPRGLHEFDYRFGLKQMLVEMGVSPTGATGDLRKARIRRKTDPSDPGSPDTFVPVDLLRVMTDDAYDVKIQDMDTLDIPLSEQFIYVFGEIGGAHKVYLPQDRPWYLSDVIANGGTNAGAAKIGAISIIRQVNGKPVGKSYDFGRYLKSMDQRQNPQVQAGDLVYVPNVKRPDLGSVWNAFGFYNIFRAIFPGSL